MRIITMSRFINKLFVIVLAIASFWVYANEDDGITIVKPIKSIEEQLVLNVSDDEKFNELFEKYKTYYLDLESVYSSYIFLQKLYEDSPFEWVKGAEIYTSTRGFNKTLNNPFDGYDESENKELNEISDLRLSQPNSVTLKNIESNLNKVRVKRSVEACGQSCHGSRSGGGGGSSSGGGGSFNIGGGHGSLSGGGFNPKTIASDLGYKTRIPPQRSPFDSHGQPVFSNGKGYISPDADGHNITRGWKKFDRKGTRTGTWNSDLSIKIKD
ncbi:MAG: putative membrane protein YgcG [Moritella dasanensis]|jgi:uncharacterized membrane protein YgcG